ncbi:hypothetical protein CPB83DRAFT_727737, partial [Crepidotus variabilis]
IFISFFFKKPKPKKKVTVARGASGARFRRPGELAAEDEDEEIILDGYENESDENDDDEDDTAVEEVAEAAAEEEDDDDGQGVHNERVCRTLKDKAIIMMEAKGVFIDHDEEKMALQIFPRMAGLARRVHDNTTLKERFVSLVKKNDDLQGTQRTLTRRVPTRWNSDFNCLNSHFHFRDVVEALTSTSSLGLRAYHLSDDQWLMAEDVCEVLLLFDTVTRVFSMKEVPLIVDVVPTLEDLREGLIAARDDTINDVSNIVKIACQASILLVDKYSTFADNCDIYLIAIAMCPDRKLKWFKDHGRTPRQIKEIEKLIIEKWTEVYSPDEDEE